MSVPGVASEVQEAVPERLYSRSHSGDARSCMHISTCNPRRSLSPSQSAKGTGPNKFLTPHDLSRSSRRTTRSAPAHSSAQLRAAHSPSRPHILFDTHSLSTHTSSTHLQMNPHTTRQNTFHMTRWNLEFGHVGGSDVLLDIVGTPRQLPAPRLLVVRPSTPVRHRVRVVPQLVAPRLVPDNQTPIRPWSCIADIRGECCVKVTRCGAKTEQDGERNVSRMERER